MDATQRERWEQASLGLARSAYPNLTPARQTRLLEDIESFIRVLVSEHGLDGIRDWDANGGGVYVGDELSEYLWDNRYKQERWHKGDCEAVCGTFGTMLEACVRAGFDLAVNPSAGVLGFTVGNLREAFGGLLPDWVAGWFDPPLLPGTPDAEEVWL